MIDTKRIYKSETDKRIWGVCGGLAQYFNVDPTLVRLLFIVLTLIGGPGVIIYIILGLVMPDAPRARQPPQQADHVVARRPDRLVEVNDPEHRLARARARTRRGGSSWPRPATRRWCSPRPGRGLRPRRPR